MKSITLISIVSQVTDRNLAKFFSSTGSTSPFEFLICEAFSIILLNLISIKNFQLIVNNKDIITKRFNCFP